MIIRLIPSEAFPRLVLYIHSTLKIDFDITHLVFNPNKLIYLTPHLSRLHVSSRITRWRSRCIHWQTDHQRRRRPRSRGTRRRDRVPAEPSTSTGQHPLMARIHRRTRGPTTHPWTQAKNKRVPQRVQGPDCHVRGVPPQHSGPQVNIP